MKIGLERDKRGSHKLLQHRKATSFVKLSEGAITVRKPQTVTAVASGPRCVVTQEGEVVCSFMVQTALGSNNFCPMLTRSKDHGNSWHEQGPLWPHLRDTYSLFGSISRSRQGDIFFYGSRTQIDSPDETFWCETNQGIKANELFWARSTDNGCSWSDPKVIPMPIPGSAEAPGAMCIAEDGAWHTCYAPYNTLDPAIIVPRNQVVLISSRDGGHSWQHTAMMRFSDELATAAEAWVVELADGRLLGTCWNVNQRDDSDYPNAYALSDDGGRTWSATLSTGILGQTTALTPLSDGSALFIYNQRKHGKIGVWMARVLPTAEDFGVLSNEIVWDVPQAISSNNHSEWTNFTFGEPSATLLDEDTVLLALWCIQTSVGSIQYVKLKSNTLL